jgi:hypothetical protein
MKITFKLIITAVLCSFSLFMTAQETVSAHIIDAETRQPIDLVSVVSSVNGTITNREGGFIVQIAPNDHLQLSHVSYYTQNIPVGQVGDTILLQPRVVELAEFVVMPRDVIVRELTAVWNKYYNLLRNRRDRDFPVQTFYYRQLTRNDDVYVEYIEAFFTALTSVRVRELYLQEGRFARANRAGTAEEPIFWFTNFFIFSHVTPFSLENARILNVANPFLVRDFEILYDINIVRIISPDSDDETIVYQFTPFQENIGINAIMLSGQLYVRTRDLAIVHMEIFANDIGARGIPNVTNEIHHFSVTYREGIKAYPTVESVRAESVITHLLPNGQPHQMRISSLLYAVDHPIETRRRRARNLRQNDVLLRRIARLGHNQEFWDNNPFVMRTAIEQRVLDDFIRAGYFGSMSLNE